MEKALTESKTLQASLDEQREVYRPIAARGSVMYFLLADLQVGRQGCGFLHSEHAVNLQHLLCLCRP